MSILINKTKADKSASDSLNPSIFEGLVTLCAPDAVCFSRHIPHASGRILAERFYVIGTLRSNFLLHKKDTNCSQCLSHLNYSLFSHKHLIQSHHYRHGHNRKVSFNNKLICIFCLFFSCCLLSVFCYLFSLKYFLTTSNPPLGTQNLSLQCLHSS